jgi:hypothetical protein
LAAGKRLFGGGGARQAGAGSIQVGQEGRQVLGCGFVFFLCWRRFGGAPAPAVFAAEQVAPGALGFVPEFAPGKIGQVGVVVPYKYGHQGKQEQGQGTGDTQKFLDPLADRLAKYAADREFQRLQEKRSHHRYDHHPDDSALQRCG